MRTYSRFASCDADCASRILLGLSHVSGHEFTRAKPRLLLRGFSPWEGALAIRQRNADNFTFHFGSRHVSGHEFTRAEQRLLFWALALGGSADLQAAQCKDNFTFHLGSRHVSGHEFTRAKPRLLLRGFSPWEGALAFRPANWGLYDEGL